MASACKPMSRRRALEIVESALLECEINPPPASQLADLADAVDALQAGQIQAAVILAKAAVAVRRELRTAIRPSDMIPSIPDLRSTLYELRINDESA